ncbi:MAG: glycosyltransferase family 2 protein [Candidatus Melainabacteria bacterium]|nr:glycosyltransferase family 2 protein [Candidatus Melainabacteria bacterium]
MKDYDHYKLLISVIIPFFNQRLDLCKIAIESILLQSYCNWEVIIVNDGSSVEITNKLEKYVSTLNEKRISIIHLKKNFGVSIAKNKGIEKAQGEIITFLDADDFILPWHLQEIMEELKLNPGCKIIAGKYLYFASFYFIKKITRSAYPRSTSNDKFQLIPPQLSFKKEVFNLLKFDEKTSALEDLDLRLQIMNNQELLNRTIVTDISSYIYRIYPATTRITHKPLLMLNAIKYIKEKYIKDKAKPTYKVIKYDLCEQGRCRYNDEILALLIKGDFFFFIKKSLPYIFSIDEVKRRSNALVYTLLFDKFLTKYFGIDLRYLMMIFIPRRNLYKEIRNKFLSCISTDKSFRKFFHDKEKEMVVSF